MMDATQSLPDLIAAATTTAKTYEDRIAAALQETETPARTEELREATVGLEAVAIDIFAVFEARQQHHFKRGPFSRKLTALLTSSGEADLAERLHQHYLAINVLKHGRGASHRELMALKNSPFVVKAAPKFSEEEDAPTDEPQTVGLVDVTRPDFFAGLRQTILDAVNFLDNK